MLHPLTVVEAVAARNVHVREMFALYNLAAKFNITNARVEANLDQWVSEWLARNPRQAELLLQASPASEAAS